MDSDAPALGTLAADLVAALTAALPTEWRIQPAEEGMTESLATVLLYEQGDIVTSINGGPVPPGHVGVEFTLTIAAPELEPVKGIVTATDAVIPLLVALDGLDSVYWDSATKGIFATGETIYRLEVVSLSRFTNRTTNPEPDTMPDTMPEEA
ncbi:hypothetical protein [Microbacterium sp. Leaf320]|uniref:hypothetical protein n=1 Tax=Microbacterium sp. Leaf320 TaxID=1736334 RepID=UPI0006F81653|nr:hypothetical protein [Microbacterium sp. Leaf320]KQQ65194.1 hypothetical protein ASF63_14650 [Microbacterium sp. Leaf320]